MALDKERVKGDERILGESAFVLEVLSAAQEKLSGRYELKQKGVTFEALQRRVCELYGIQEAELLSGSRERVLVQARSLLAYWAVDLLGVSETALAEKFGMTQPAIAYAVRRGRAIGGERGYTAYE